LQNAATVKTCSWEMQIEGHVFERGILNCFSINPVEDRPAISARQNASDMLHPVGKGRIRCHEKYEYVRRCGVCSGEMWNFLTRLVPFNSAAFRSTTYAKELTKQLV
jgi:hypothetical protein